MRKVWGHRLGKGLYHIKLAFCHVNYNYLLLGAQELLGYLCSSLPWLSQDSEYLEPGELNVYLYLNLPVYKT